MVGKNAREWRLRSGDRETGAGTRKTLHTEFEHDCIHAGGPQPVSQSFENIDQPGRRLQHIEPMRQLFFAVDVAEQLSHGFVGRMNFRSFSKRTKACAQLGAPRLQLVVSLAKAELSADRVLAQTESILSIGEAWQLTLIPSALNEIKMRASHGGTRFVR